MMSSIGKFWQRLAISLALFSAVSFLTCARADDPDSGESKVGATKIDEAELNAATEHSRALSRAFRFAARKATPSVVTILSYGQKIAVPNREAQEQDREAPENTPDKSTEPDDKRLTGLGSGVIVSADGMVITNNHVIRGAKRVVVKLSDETEIEATDVHGDTDSDVATLKISREEGFACTELADSDAVEIGDWVLAIGSPFRLEATVSAGIISAKNRSLKRINRGRLIQTDAAINPGNSGGPLVDLDGRTVAISTAIATRNGGYQGIGFAIPINHAKWIADELAKHGRVRRAAMGTTLVELKPRIAMKFNLQPNLGVLVYQIIEDSVADRAGFKQLDVILEFAGERVRSSNSLQEVIERKPIGSIQEVKILRDGEEIMLQVELATVDDPTGTKKEPADRKQDTGEEKEASESEDNSSAIP
jgi:serine protease Do